VAAASTHVLQPGQHATPPGGMPSRTHPLTHWAPPGRGRHHPRSPQGRHPPQRRPAARSGHS